MRIGVLALQGAFAEHVTVFRSLGAECSLVRLPSDLVGLDGVVLPGGESTSMRLLARDARMMVCLREFGSTRPIWGVCAGLILLAKEIEGEEPALGLLDIVVARNAYGRQQQSFVAEIQVAGLENAEIPLPGVFIRAPCMRAVGARVDVLSRHESTVVAVRQGHVLGTAFHPELTADTRVHAFFLRMCGQGG